MSKPTTQQPTTAFSKPNPMILQPLSELPVGSSFKFAAGDTTTVFTLEDRIPAQMGLCDLYIYSDNTTGDEFTGELKVDTLLVQRVDDRDLLVQMLIELALKDHDEPNTPLIALSIRAHFDDGGDPDVIISNLKQQLGGARAATIKCVGFRIARLLSRVSYCSPEIATA